MLHGRPGPSKGNMTDKAEPPVILWTMDKEYCSPVLLFAMTELNTPAGKYNHHPCELCLGSAAWPRFWSNEQREMSNEHTVTLYLELPKNFQLLPAAPRDTFSSHAFVYTILTSRHPSSRQWNQNIRCSKSVFGLLQPWLLSPSWHVKIVRCKPS
jgi:hypothetical protein